MKRILRIRIRNTALHRCRIWIQEPNTSISGPAPQERPTWLSETIQCTLILRSWSRPGAKHFWIQPEPTLWSALLINIYLYALIINFGVDVNFNGDLFWLIF